MTANHGGLSPCPTHILQRGKNQRMPKEQHKLQPGECLDLDQEGETGQAMCNINGRVEDMQVAEAELNDYDIVNQE